MVFDAATSNCAIVSSSNEAPRGVAVHPTVKSALALSLAIPLVAIGATAGTYSEGSAGDLGNSFETRTFLPAQTTQVAGTITVNGNDHDQDWADWNDLQPGEPFTFTFVSAESIYGASFYFTLYDESQNQIGSGYVPAGSGQQTVTGTVPASGHLVVKVYGGSYGRYLMLVDGAEYSESTNGDFGDSFGCRTFLPAQTINVVGSINPPQAPEDWAAWNDLEPGAPFAITYTTTASTGLGARFQLWDESQNRIGSEASVPQATSVTVTGTVPASGQLAVQITTHSTNGVSYHITIDSPRVSNPPPPPDSQCESPPPPPNCDVHSWIAGTVDLCGGQLIYRDYVYDDYGAQGTQQGPSTGSLSNPTGTQSYPNADANVENNYADIAAIRLRVSGSQLLVSFEMNSLFDADSTLAALAIDTDDNPATGGGAWNFCSFPAAPCPLAAMDDPVLGLIPLSSAGWDELHLFTVGDPATNRIEGAIPMPPGTRWRIQAVAAVAGATTVMNVAFRHPSCLPDCAHEGGNWLESEQAAALQSGDISQFGYRVDVADLTGGVTRHADPGPGYYERVYASDWTIAPDGTFHTGSEATHEGVNYDGIPGRGVAGAGGAFAQEFHFVGHNQPYGIFIPDLPGPHGVQLALHGYSADHTSLVDSANPLHQGLQDHIGTALNRILVVPLGRGPAGWYSDISERDVLDVMADVEANYIIDRDRVYSGGYSMGGYGTLRFATTYPDRFAGYIDWVGYPGDAFGHPEVQQAQAGEVGIPAEWMMNVREVDGAMLYGGADELVNAAQGTWLRDIMAGLGYPNIFYFHPAADHFTYALADDWQKEAAYTANLVRRTRPPRVTFRTAPYADSPELGIRHDRAYWVSDIVSSFDEPYGERDYADVDIKTYGCGGSERTFGADPPGAGDDPVPWESQSFSVTGSTPIAQQNRIEATLANVESLVVDVRNTGACIANAPVAYHVVTNGPTAIALNDGRELSFPAAGTYDGTFLPEPGATVGFAGGAGLLAALARRRKRERA
jgi:pimeloyl-ACP methyl ester carboxylesterase